MRSHSCSLGLVGMLLLLVACGGAQPEPTLVKAPPLAPPDSSANPLVAAASSAAALVRVDTPDAPFREKAPVPGPDVAFVAPRASSFALKNGVRVVLVERHDLPVVAVRLVVRAGAGEGERAGMFSMLGSMLEQGTASKNALELSDAYEALGAQHSAWFDWDSGGLFVKVLAKDLEPAIRLMSDSWLHPALPEAELERLRQRRLVAIGQERMSPAAMAQNALAASLFGRAHPYGHSLSGRIGDIESVTRAALVKLHGSRLAPSRLAVVVAGDVTRATLEPFLEANLGGLPKSSGETLARPPQRNVDGLKERITFVHLKGATQSNVVVAGLGTDASYKTRDALAVMNSILGGAFGSRVNMNLREKHAYTYGARSRFAARRGVGPFTVGGAIVADHTGDAIVEIFSELEGLRTGVVTEEELGMAKQNIQLGLPGRFETVSDVALALSELAIQGLPLDDYTSKAARVAAVTAADVQREAKAFLGKERLRVVVVGDRDKVLAQLKTAADKLGLGAVAERDAFGDVAAVLPVVRPTEAKSTPEPAAKPIPAQ
jgi:zinc protease